MAELGCGTALCTEEQGRLDDGGWLGKADELVEGEAAVLVLMSDY